MKKRSFFFKEYLTHFILIVVAFTLAGSVFYHQMASYALRAKQTELKTTVQSLAEQSKLMQGTDSDALVLTLSIVLFYQHFLFLFEYILHHL